MSTRHIIRRCSADLSRWSRAGRDRARPNKHSQRFEPRSGIARLSPRDPILVATTRALTITAAGRLLTVSIRQRRAEIPIGRRQRRHLLPAGSFPEGFRTTAPVLAA